MRPYWCNLLGQQYDYWTLDGEDCGVIAQVNPRSKVPSPTQIHPTKIVSTSPTLFCSRSQCPPNDCPIPMDCVPHILFRDSTLISKPSIYSIIKDLSL